MNHMLKAQLPTLLAEKEKEQQVRSVAVHDVRITVRFVSSYSEIPKPLNCGDLTSDSRSDKVYSKKKKNHMLKAQLSTLLVEKELDSRIADSMAVHDVRVTVTCASSYTGT